MITENLEDFLIEVEINSPILGIDLGDKTIGVAVSDKQRTVASGLKTIWRKKFSSDVKLLIELIRYRQIGGIILGLPKNMNGSEGPRCQSTRAFAKNLSERVEIPITFWDERLSSVAAEKALLEANISRKRRSEVIDYVAASYILQGALDRLENINSNQEN